MGRRISISLYHEDSFLFINSDTCRESIIPYGLGIKGHEIAFSVVISDFPFISFSASLRRMASALAHPLILDDEKKHEHEPTFHQDIPYSYPSSSEIIFVLPRIWK